MRYEFRTHARISYRETKHLSYSFIQILISSSSPARHSNIRLTCNPRLARFVRPTIKARIVTGRVVRSKRLLAESFSINSTYSISSGTLFFIFKSAIHSSMNYLMVSFLGINNNPLGFHSYFPSIPLTRLILFSFVSTPSLIHIVVR